MRSRKKSGASAFGGCWPAAVGMMVRVAARGVGLRVPPGRLRVRFTVLAVAVKQKPLERDYERYS